MPNTLVGSVKALLDPELLSQVLGEPISQIERAPLSAKFAHSGSGLEFIYTNHGCGPTLVLKRVATEWDWLMRATRDFRCRSVMLWQYGLLDRLPAVFAPPVEACAIDGNGWAILMSNYGESFVTNRRFTPAEHQLFLDAIAEMHATFWDDPLVRDSAVGLCTLEDVFCMFTPRIARRHGTGAGEIPERIVEGWRLAGQVMPAEAMRIIAPLLDDAGPLRRALLRYPLTLVHGDFRHSNLGVRTSSDGSSSVVLLDWQLAAAAPPTVELGRYIGANSPLLPTGKAETLSYYAERLTHHLQAHGHDTLDAEDLDRQLRLGMLGGFLQDGWAIVLKAGQWRVGADARAHWQADLEWWAKQVLRGAALLEH